MKGRFLKALGVAALALGSVTSAFADIHFKDVIGRDIHLEKPAESIFLGFYFEDYLAIAGPDAYKKVSIFPRHSWKDYRQSQWETYSKIIPELETIVDSGSIYTGTFDFEKLLSTKPDVALVAAWQYKSLGEKVEILEKSGIKVVVVDFNAQTLEKHVTSARVIGKVMGTENRAEAIATEYENTVNDVKQRVAKYLKNHDARRVYVEIGTGGPNEFGKSYSNAMWGNILNMAGADNIANGKFKGSAHLTPEYVLSKDPEVIFVSGAHWAKHSDSALLGFGTTMEEAQARYRPYLNRAGWKQLTAVKNGDVYGMYHSGTRTIYDHVFLQYLAKSIYPEAFKDVDPKKSHQNFFNNYMPQALKGTFMIQVEG
ncbi:putative ABC-type Fe3+-hydroxamate transport system, periplasmic component [Vibrio nigripulchritudo MADA3029]|uniref:ABC transporter substrate-binding protein n=1 Tax=Vibrio nigripulchritudo TaxID=28173 RepID=UPI0003B1EF1E|nr:ABC transporter substrate-binding protein [Vibrio nigripulchritudo]CCN46637.1 putative ABC-type Fe3+-hydroxamate transport system, periplasmic component [Vibrio nigripulchritudo MADA3020]CCN54586.1 putative ABC-type Fe3+-hydroxamate transport system, periplasmic component [Vibrio nigripulchritudo MADA3021]CCN59496.1 putative ABC-type Fe3+-hydroxamate transport system, periplasmic component [Vibrio nigripulchritudo MADA3029]